MAGSLNKVTLIGNLGADPEIRRMNDGRPVANLRIATSDRWRDKATGEMRERTEWHRVVVFNERLAETIERYLRKGSKLYIEGQLQTRKWQDQGGQDRYTTEIVLQGFGGQMVMLDGRDSGAGGAGYQQDQQQGSQSAGQRPAASGSLGDEGGFGGAPLDDEIPF